MLIMTTMAAAVALSTNAAKQTAKMEADRIAAVISRLIERADRTQNAFWFMLKDDGFYICWGKKYDAGRQEKLDFKITPGCSYSAVNNYKNMCYLADDASKIPAGAYIKILQRNVSVKKASQPVTGNNRVFNVKVTGSDNSEYYVIISQNGA